MSNLIIGEPMQIDFTVPLGAVSGDLTVSVRGELTSEATSVIVYLEDPAGAWTTCSIRFAEGTKDYWAAGNYSYNNRFMPIYYDATAGKWIKVDKSGTYLCNILYCSTKTDRFGRIYCGYGALSTGEGATRKAETSTASNPSPCINIGRGGDQVNVRGAAADPNTQADPSRDIAYFAFHNDAYGKNYIKKIKSDCGQILDYDYGNFGGSLVFNIIVGMAVDLYGNYMLYQIIALLGLI